MAVYLRGQGIVTLDMEMYVLPVNGFEANALFVMNRASIVDHAGGHEAYWLADPEQLQLAKTRYAAWIDRNAWYVDEGILTAKRATTMESNYYNVSVLHDDGYTKTFSPVREVHYFDAATSTRIPDRRILRRFAALATGDRTRRGAREVRH